MPDKPKTRNGYPPGQVELVKATCLYLATRLGDLMDEIVVVGGLVPALLINQSNLPENVPEHAGTMDLDLGLALTILSKDRYSALTERLRSAGLSPDRNDEGNLTRQRWTIERAKKVTVDFLIPPSSEEDEGGKLKHIDRDFAALINECLPLAFDDRERVHFSGRTIDGESAERDIWVCGPGAFVVLKALAIQNRGEEKDAYDLFYLIQNFPGGVDAIAARLRPLLSERAAQNAIDLLQRNCASNNGIVPRRVAYFMNQGPDEDIQADVVGYVSRLLQLLKIT